MRNRVGKKEVVWWVIIQQVLQTGFAFLLSYLDGEEMTGFEQVEQYKLYLRVVGVEASLLKGLMFLGVDGLKLGKKVGSGFVELGGLLKGVDAVRFESTIPRSSGDWRMDIAAILYWYILPAMRLWLALFILDTWQYFMHRLMHTVPALYSIISLHLGPNSCKGHNC